MNRCKLIECLGKTRCNACMAMDAAYPPAVDDKELARFVSETIAHGIGLALIYKGMPAADLVAQVTAERVAMFRALTPNAAAVPTKVGHERPVLPQQTTPE